MGIEHFTFLSEEGRTRIHGVCWKPKQDALRGILQITHGMVEYIERYDGFARYMNERGYLVVGHDHLGHGQSVTDKSQWGYFGEHGSDTLIADMHKLRTMTREKYPELPYFMLGHSMGSFLLRRYLTLHGEGLQGAIIMGTGTQPDIALRAGKAICSALARVRGWHYRSRMVNSLAFSGNNKRFAKEGLSGSWLTRDAEIVKAYSAAPECSFCFTLNGFYSLFDTIWEINRSENLARMPRNLPLFFVSGAEDPVGGYGAGVKKAYDAYDVLGMEDLTWKLYEKDRHEILNELDREQVYEDLYHWMEVRLAT